MSLLDVLVGGSCPSQQGSYFSQKRTVMETLQERGLAQAQQQYIPKCIHPNCPICLKETKDRQEKEMKLKEERDKKEEEYKNCCKIYLKKIREKMRSRA